MLFHSVTEEDVVRRNCLAKSCPYCVRNSLLEDQNHSIIPKFHSYLPRSHTDSVFLSETTSEEIVNIIKDFKNGKSSDIPVIVAKHVKETIAPHLNKLYNNCILSGEFPPSLKIGRITPIHKKRPKERYKELQASINTSNIRENF